MTAPRARQPRPALVLRPSFVSQETAFAVLGLTPRKFLEQVAPLCESETTRLGRTVLVPTEVAEAVLRKLARGPSDCGPDDDGERQPTSADAVLAAVGVRRRRSQ